MSANWDYAQLTKRASELGGPRGLIENVWNAGHARGMVDGGLIATGAVLVAGGVIKLVCWAKEQYDLKQAVGAESEALLIANMEAAEAADDRVESCPADEKPSDGASA